MRFEETIEWKKHIRHWALELGFVAVGFTTAEEIKGLGTLLQERRKKTLSTSFEEIDLAKRVNPQAVWPSCKSVAALAFPLPLTAAPQKGEGIFARSGVGEDYHITVRAKLDKLVQKILEKEWPSETPRIQVDTGPLNERAFARRSGIGWIGRNQQLIVKEYGSFVSLALLLLDQDMPSDKPLLNLCGECNSCVQHCPAEILGEEVFPANRCFSYLSQTKEMLEEEQTKKMGLRIYGCDSCQEACPHNQKFLREERESLDPKISRGVDLLKVLNLTKGEFNNHFRRTAAGWRGKGILQRNAYFGLQNLKDKHLEEWIKERNKASSLPPLIEPYVKSLLANEENDER